MDDIERTQRFRQLHKESGLSSKRIGDLLGVTKATVYAWKYGKYPIPVEKFKKFSSLVRSVENVL